MILLNSTGSDIWNWTAPAIWRANTTNPPGSNPRRRVKHKTALIILKRKQRPVCSPKRSSTRSSRLCNGLVFERGEDAFKNPFAVVAAQRGFAGAFGMRHQAGHVAAFAANAGDVLHRPVGICGVGQVPAGVAVLPEDLVVDLELCQRFLVGKIAALAVGDGNAENFSRRNPVRERRVGRGGFQVNVFAVELQISVADEGAWQQAGFSEGL